MWNSTAARSALQMLSSAQARFRDGRFADEDGDGIGEYGTMAELAGVAPVRGGRAAPPQLSGAYRQLSDLGESLRSGYVFRVFLASPDGTATAGDAHGVSPGAVHAESAETHWCAYAWPTAFDRSAVETYFAAADGSVWETTDSRYDGPGRGPPPGAAFVTGGIASVGGGLPSADPSAREVRTQDGNVWRRVD